MVVALIASAIFLTQATDSQVLAKTNEFVRKLALLDPQVKYPQADVEIDRSDPPRQSEHLGAL